MDTEELGRGMFIRVMCTSSSRLSNVSHSGWLVPQDICEDYDGRGGDSVSVLCPAGRY